MPACVSVFVCRPFLVIQFFVLTLLIISMTFVISLTLMFYHCRLFDIEHNSFHFGLCGRKFVQVCYCLVSVHVSAP